MCAPASENLKSSGAQMMPDSVKKNRYRYKELQMSRFFYVFVFLYVSY